MAGKGDKRRLGNSEKLISNWDRIFGTKDSNEDINTSDVEPFHIKNAKHLKVQDLEFREKLAEEKRRKEKELFDRLDKEVEEENDES